MRERRRGTGDERSGWGTRRKPRELTLQMLFQSEMGKQAPDEVRRTFWSQRADVEEETRGFADDLFRTATERTAEIDALIQKHAEHCRLERMAAVGRNYPRSAVVHPIGRPRS